MHKCAFNLPNFSCFTDGEHYVPIRAQLGTIKSSYELSIFFNVCYAEIHMLLIIGIYNCGYASFID